MNYSIISITAATIRTAQVVSFPYRIAACFLPSPMTVLTYSIRALHATAIALRIMSYFIPAAMSALRYGAAQLVLAGCAAYEAGGHTRNFIENRLGIFVTNGLNEITYSLHPKLAPAAQSVQYFIEDEIAEGLRQNILAFKSQDCSQVEDTSVAKTEDPWALPSLPRKYPVWATSGAINTITPQVLLKAATESVDHKDFAAMTIYDLRKMGSSFGIKGAARMNKAPLIAALSSN